jgi:predicted alpha/beta superfamily hydrolase
MKKLIAAFLVLLTISCKTHVPDESTKPELIHSAITNDDYLLQFRLPDDYDEKKGYHLVFVADGTIGLGEYVLGTNKSWKADLPSNCVIVTIGHEGDWEEKRRRDFIPSDFTGNNEENFGNAAKFYVFLKTQLVPSINKKFPHQKDRSFVGHSFSGLFCLYAALKNEILFNHYFAISPSVWANDEELLKIEESFSKTNKELNASIKIYAGGLEIFNKVLSSCKTFYNAINSHGYKNLSISFETIGAANHFSIRKPAIDRILKLISADNR